MSQVKYKINENYFSEIVSPSQAYILGFLYADGSVSKKKGKVNITLGLKDISILHFIKNELQSNHPLKIVKEKYVSLSITRVKLCNDLIRHGIIPNKTYKSTMLPRVAEDLFSPMLLGFFDGDGGISYNKNTDKYSVNFSSNRFVLQTLHTFFLNNGINSYLSQRGNNNFSWSLSVTGSVQIKKIWEILYSNSVFSLERKRNMFLKNNIMADKYIQNTWTLNGLGALCIELYGKGVQPRNIAKTLNQPVRKVYSFLDYYKSKSPVNRYI